MFLLFVLEKSFQFLKFCFYFFAQKKVSHFWKNTFYFLAEKNFCDFENYLFVFYSKYYFLFFNFILFFFLQFFKTLKSKKMFFIFCNFSKVHFRKKSFAFLFSNSKPFYKEKSLCFFENSNFETPINRGLQRVRFLKNKRNSDFSRFFLSFFIFCNNSKNFYSHRVLDIKSNVCQRTKKDYYLRAINLVFCCNFRKYRFTTRNISHRKNGSYYHR